eukprot:2081333-Rhodomonas_salina.1
MSTRLLAGCSGPAIIAARKFGSVDGRRTKKLPEWERPMADMRSIACCFNELFDAWLSLDRALASDPWGDPDGFGLADSAVRTCSVLLCCCEVLDPTGGKGSPRTPSSRVPSRGEFSALSSSKCSKSSGGESRE